MCQIDTKGKPMSEQEEAKQGLHRTAYAAGEALRHAGEADRGELDPVAVLVMVREFLGKAAPVAAGLRGFHLDGQAALDADLARLNDWLATQEARPGVLLGEVRAAGTRITAAVQRICAL